MKPRMHPVEISATVTSTKIIKSRQKLGTFLENKVFHKSKISKYVFDKSWSPSPISFKDSFLERFRQFSTLKNDFENQTFQMFVKVVHNFAMSDITGYLTLNWTL